MPKDPSRRITSHPGRNLLQRIITALVLAPLVVWGILALVPQYFALIVAAAVLIGAWEWSGLAGWGRPIQRIAYTGATGLFLYGLLWWDNFFVHGWLWLSAAALVCWCVVLSWIIRFEREMSLELMENPLVAMHMLTDAGPLLVIVLMVLIWGADSGAYFTGKRFGKRRLCPRTSPGKSWEGVAGGLVVTGALATVVIWFAELSAIPGIVVVALSLITALVSVLGDVGISLFKRRIGIKDSGRLFPGHGGMLDRIDSLTAAAPFFGLAAYLTNNMWSLWP